MQCKDDLGTRVQGGGMVNGGCAHGDEAGLWRAWDGRGRRARRWAPAMHDCPPLSAMQLECGHGRSSLGAVGGAHAGSNGTGASMAPHTNRVRLCRTPLVGAVTRSPCAVDPCGSQGCSPAIRTQCLILPLNHAARSQTCGTAWFVPAWIQHTTYARSDLAGMHRCESCTLSIVLRPCPRLANQAQG